MKTKQPSHPSNPNPVDLPQGGVSKSFGETFSPNTFTGTANLNIPLPTTPGRGEPDLVLRYNHGTANGAFGLGFSLNLSQISRRTTKGIPQYQDDDIFLLDSKELTPRYTHHPTTGWTLDQTDQIFLKVSYRVTRFRPRSEGPFLKIEHWRDPKTRKSFWKTTDRENKQSWYGFSDQSRVFDPEHPTHIYQWLIDHSLDRFGNKTRYVYKTENHQNVPNTSYNQGRTAYAQKYIEKVFYGNYLDSQKAEHFAFEVLFNYGEYSPTSVPLVPQQDWAIRKDCFSDYRAGFEIRTQRLCQSILMVHHFPKELPADDCLVNEIRLEYHSDAIHSLLKSAQQTGYRMQPNQSYWTQSLAPVEVQYDSFSPEKSSFHPLHLKEGSPLEGTFPQGYLQWADLYGEGLPGILYNDSESVLYFPPEGHGRFSPPRPLPRFPDVQGESPSHYQLKDVSGNGHLDLVVHGDADKGFFYNRNNGEWEPFRPFESYPTESQEPAQQWVDLNGDGLSDLLIPVKQGLRFYLSKGDKGFSKPITLPTVTGFPELGGDSARSVITFADMVGDGLAHCVRIHSGRVEVWPNLGYGHFGQKWIMAGSPQFSDNLPKDRIFLADCNGSGTADLLFVYERHLELYLNESGNSFAPEISIPLPFRVTHLDQVNVTDVLGKGNACVVLSQVTSRPTQHTYYDFCGDLLPYMMTSSTNNMGRKTDLTFRSSTEFYLKDREAGAPWVTRLAHPVMVVDQIVHTDEISGTQTIQNFQYRDGYYDPVEREFRGFGYVQTQDTHTFDPKIWHFPSVKKASDLPLVAPTLTKTWNHTGAFLERGVVSKQFEAQYYSRDPQALVLGDSVLDSDIVSGSSATLRQAYVALSHQMIRQEVYGVSAQGVTDLHPYSVEEYNYTVQLEQPTQSRHHASFWVVPRETVHSAYEKTAADPCIQHHLTLDWDHSGNILTTATAYYPRRKTTPPILPGQHALKVILETETVINLTGKDVYLLGKPAQSESFELNGISPSKSLYFDYDAFKTAIDPILASKTYLDYGVDFTKGMQARRFKWSRTLYWDANLKQDALLGTTSAQALVHHTLEAIFPQGYVQTVYGSKVPPFMLTSDGAYVLKDGYYWRTSGVHSYDPLQYYLTDAIQNPFQVNTASKTQLTYDAYGTKATDSTNPLGQVTSYTIDYQTMEYSALTDINQNTSEVIYNPLGQVMVTSRHGINNGVYEGNMELKGYQWQAAPSLSKILKNPETYLQGASFYFFYDAQSWSGKPKQPIHSIGLKRKVFTHSAKFVAGTQPGPIEIVVYYADGFARHLCQKTQVESDATDSAHLPKGAGTTIWCTTLHQVYDEKGQVLKQYLPYFQSDVAFDSTIQVGATSYAYDALERPIRINTPKGFFHKVVHPNAWEEVEYDLNNTMMESTYYQQNIHNPKLPPTELAALQQTELFQHAWHTKHFNCQEQLIQESQINLTPKPGKVQPETYSQYYELDIAGNPLKVIDPRFYDPKQVLSPQHYQAINQFDMRSQTLSHWNCDSGTQWSLHDTMEMILSIWDAKGYHRKTSYESVIRRPASMTVNGNGLNQITERLEYGNSPQHNTVNAVVKHYDQSGLLEIPKRDLFGNPTQTFRTFRKEIEPEVNWNTPASVPLFAKKWSQTWTYDALGHLIEEGHADGSVTRHHTYANGWLRSIEAKWVGKSPFDSILKSIRYNAHSEPLSFQYNNGLETTHTYDPLDLRLRKTVSKNTKETFQNFEYVYDPVGNITDIIDHAKATLLPGGAPPSVSSHYVYDALYRLISAKGMQQIGAPTPVKSLTAVQLTTYTQQYHYDRANNLTQWTHEVLKKKETHTVKVAPDSNRAVPQFMITPKKTVDDFYDPNGNLLQLSHFSSEYDYRNQISKTTAADISRYAYDFQRKRTRKQTQKPSGTGVEIEETFIMGHVHVTETFTGATPQTALQSKPSHSSSELQIVAFDKLILSHRVDKNSANPTLTYPLTNHQGSVALDLDVNGTILRYVDYFPYGSFSMNADLSVSSDMEPQILFSGEEYDPTTGLYYYGARYYVPFLGRWMTPDPLGDLDDLNLYSFVRGNPVTHRDHLGFGVEKTTGPIKRKGILKRLERQNVTSYGRQKAIPGDVGWGGTVDLSDPRLVWSAYTPLKTNNGVGLQRIYPMTSEAFRGDVVTNRTVPARTVRTAFKNLAANIRGYIRGHRLPHADTMRISPASSVLSTYDANNYYAEPEGWGEQQRRHREAKARANEITVFQFERYDAHPLRTQNGTPIPRSVTWVELTEGKPDYNIKVYEVEYATFDYDALATPVGKATSRRATNELRQRTLPNDMINLITRMTSIKKSDLKFGTPKPGRR